MDKVFDHIALQIADGNVNIFFNASSSSHLLFQFQHQPQPLLYKVIKFQFKEWICCAKDVMQLCSCKAFLSLVQTQPPPSPSPSSSSPQQVHTSSLIFITFSLSSFCLWTKLSYFPSHNLSLHLAFLLTPYLLITGLINRDSASFGHQYTSG